MSDQRAEELVNTQCTCHLTTGVFGCPVHGRNGGMFVPTPPTPPTTPTTTVTTRQVPVPCEVCGARGYRPDMPDDPDGEWKQCDACQGKGWLTVTETRTERVG